MSLDGAPPAGDTGASPTDAPADMATGTPADMATGTPPDLTPPGSDMAGCTPAGREECFNGRDDDCDRLVDCEDDDCDQSRARCIAEGTVGVGLTGTSPCPAEFPATDQLLGSGLEGQPCTGCSCGDAEVTCSAGVRYYYEDGLGQCQAGTASPSGDGWFSSALDQRDGCKQVSQSPLVGLHVYALNATVGACTVSGTATRGAASWAQAVRFCGAARTGGGCGPGRVCAPVRAGARQCLLLPAGQTACPSGTTSLPGSWHESFNDARTCGACSCSSATGGSCASMRVALGANVSCGPPAPLSAGLNQTSCGSAQANPAAMITGTPVKGRCMPAVTTSGLLSPVGPRTLCCL